MTQTGVLEHLKLENVTLSHELTETQQRSIKEKERIAVQLQNIEVKHLLVFPEIAINITYIDYSFQKICNTNKEEIVKIVDKSSEQFRGVTIYSDTVIY